MRFLIDVNLPKKFSFFNHSHYTFVADINPCWTDEELWSFALENDLVIVIKDTDFFLKYLWNENSPKIIQVDLGNCSLKEMHHYFSQHWQQCLELIEQHKMLLLNKNSIEIID